MSPSLLNLPAELKVRIAHLLVPFIGEPFAFPAECRTMTNDIDSVFNALYNLRRFSMTCKNTREFCSDLLFRAVSLKFDDGGVLVKESEGTLPAPFRSTVFLRLEGCEIEYGDPDPDEHSEDDSDQMSITSSESETNSFTPQEIRLMRSSSSFDYSLNRTFKHFCSVTTLDLINFTLSISRLCALEHLQALQTLSLRFVDREVDFIPAVQKLHLACSMPRVANLSVVIYDIDEARSISNVVKLFEKSLTMLSISGQDYGDGFTEDFVGGILFNDAHAIKLDELKHVNIDFLEFPSRSLRALVNNFKSLESIAVDCRGISGFLPLFYVIDLIRLATGEVFDTLPMQTYDYPLENTGQDHLNSYASDDSIWRRRLSRFYCTFANIESASGQKKVLDTLELIICSADEHLDMMNEGIRFTEITEVIHARSPTFRAARYLTVAMSVDPGWESVETEAEVKNAVALLCPTYLPAIKQFTVKWNELPKFGWSTGKNSFDEGMDIDADQLL